MSWADDPGPWEGSKSCQGMYMYSSKTESKGDADGWQRKRDADGWQNEGDGWQKADAEDKSWQNAKKDKRL